MFVSELPLAPDRRETRMVASICLAALVLPLTFSGGAIATPDLARDFGEQGPLLSWVVNAFMLTFGALPLVAGALADRVGRRRVFRFGLGGFILSGLLMLVAPSLLAVDLLRALQGIFAAATLAGGTATLAQMGDESRRRRAFSLIGATFGLGLAFGPVLAGLVLGLGGWRLVFLGASLVAAAAWALGAGAVPESRTPPVAPFDTPGAALFASALGGLTAWAVLLPGRGAGDPLVAGLLALAALALLGFVWRERRCAAPMFDLSLLREPGFLGVQVLPLATCFGFVSLLVIVPVRLIGLGYSEFEAGLLSMALSVPVFAVPLALTRIAPDNRRALVVAGLGFAAGGLVLLALTPFDGPLWPLLLALAVIGAGTGVPWGLMDGLAIELAPRERAGIATGMFSTVRVASEGVVLALVTAVLSTAIAGGTGAGEEAVARIVAGGAVAPAFAEAVAQSYRAVFLGLAGLTAAAALCVWRALKRVC